MTRFYAIAGAIAFLILIFGILSIAFGNMQGFFGCFAFGGTILLFGFYFMLMEIHEKITSEEETDGTED